jgi:hypothetical protein
MTAGLSAITVVPETELSMSLVVIEKARIGRRSLPL